eukprot:51670_1
MAQFVPETKSNYTEVLQNVLKIYRSNGSDHFESALQCLIASKLSKSEQISSINAIMPSRRWYSPTRTFLKKLKALIQGKSFFILSLISESRNVSLKRVNQMRLNVLNAITDSETSESETNHITKPAILTVLVGDDNSFQNTWYFGEAVRSLETFTSSMFINASNHYTFFRFCRNPFIPTPGKCGGYHQTKLMNTDCSDEEVKEIMKYNRNRIYRNKNSNHTRSDRTLFLLMLFMSSYYKNMVYGAIQTAMQYLSIIDNDVLSVIMEYLLSHHVNICHVFDEEFLQVMMLEVTYASRDWQDLLVDILKKDDELMEIYEPKIQTYHESESLNLLNMSVHAKRFGDVKCTKWLREALARDHFETFEKIVMDQMDAKALNRTIFRKISFELINNKPHKYMQVFQQKMSNIQNSEQLTKWEIGKITKAYDEWKTFHERTPKQIKKVDSSNENVDNRNLRRSKRLKQKRDALSTKYPAAKKRRLR